jgi:nucleoside-diphosphate-sugar epimerase
MAIFLTGSTGYLGSYLATGLFRGYRDPLNLLVRAKNRQEARERLWQSLQLHMDFPEFNDRNRDVRANFPGGPHQLSNSVCPTTNTTPSSNPPTRSFIARPRLIANPKSSAST